MAEDRQDVPEWAVAVATGVFDIAWGRLGGGDWANCPPPEKPCGKCRICKIGHAIVAAFEEHDKKTVSTWDEVQCRMWAGIIDARLDAIGCTVNSTYRQGIAEGERRAEEQAGKLREAVKYHSEQWARVVAEANEAESRIRELEQDVEIGIVACRKAEDRARQAEERAALAQADRDSEHERCASITADYRRMTKDIDAALGITAEERQEQTGDAGLRSAVKLLLERAAKYEAEVAACDGHALRDQIATLERERDEAIKGIPPRPLVDEVANRYRDRAHLAEAQVARLEEALRGLLAYVAQVELVAYPPSELDVRHAAVERAEAALAPPVPKESQ